MIQPAKASLSRRQERTMIAIQWKSGAACAAIALLWQTNAEAQTALAVSQAEGNQSAPADAAAPDTAINDTLLPVAQSLLDGMPQQECYFLRSRWADSHLSPEGLSKAQREVMERSGTSGWTLHDLRRTFRSNMARLRVTRDTCEVLINHTPKVLDEIYDRYDRLDEKREALERYEAFLMKLIGIEYHRPVAAGMSDSVSGAFPGDAPADVMLAAKMLLAQHFADLVGDPATLIAMMELKQKKSTIVDPVAPHDPLEALGQSQPSCQGTGDLLNLPSAKRRDFLTSVPNPVETTHTSVALHAP
jgi:hypothetical protein